MELLLHQNESGPRPFNTILVPFRGVFEVLRRALLSFLYGSTTWVNTDLSDVTVRRKKPYIEKTAVALRGMRMSALGMSG